jgi:hypothetical protein
LTTELLIERVLNGNAPGSRAGVSRGGGFILTSSTLFRFKKSWKNGNERELEEKRE